MESSIARSLLQVIRRLVTAALLVALSSLYVSAQAKLERFHQTHRAMGTEFAIDIYAVDQDSAETVMNLAFDEIDRLDDLLSNYRPSSELSRINREASTGPVITDPETFHFLDRSLFWSRQSDGAFDITVGPLLHAWGFFFHNGRIPSDAELTALRDRVGWQHVVLAPATRSVTFLPPRQMELDPGSIGKGFAVDRVVALLREQSVTSAFISAGSSTLYAIGAPPGAAGWPVNIPDPRHAGTIFSTILLRDSSLSTGACTEKFFIQNGHRYCHIFDPRTMRPVEGMLQTSVISPSATDSDALSTVVFVLSAKESLRALDAAPGSSALIFAQPSSAPTCTALHWQGNPCQRFSSLPNKEVHQ